MLGEISSAQPVIVVGKDNSVYLKKTRVEANQLILISINKNFDEFKMPLDDVLELWLVETKLK